MPPDPRPPHPLRRHALGLWFLGLGGLGLLRFLMHASRHANTTPDMTARLWLWGSLLLCAIGVAFVLHARRHGPHDRDH